MYMCTNKIKGEREEEGGRERERVGEMKGRELHAKNKNQKVAAIFTVSSSVTSICSTADWPSLPVN